MNLPSKSGICPLNTLTPYVFPTGAIFASLLTRILQWQQNTQCGKQSSTTESENLPMSKTIVQTKWAVARCLVGQVGSRDA